MDKLTYLAKTFSRTIRKDYENFVINAVWGRLGRDDIQPVSQQYVRNHEKGRRFIDLYFPQLNIGIECDEYYHLTQEEKDRIREEELIDVLSAINVGEYEVEHVHVHDGYDTAMRDIDAAVSALKEKIEELEAEGRLREWNPDLAAQDLLAGKEEIYVEDNIVFCKMADACNLLFDSGYDGLQQAFITPRGAFFNRFNGRYKVWFPVISVEGSNTRGWKNLINKDGSELLERNVDDRDFSEEEEVRRVVIPRVFDPVLRTRGYRFIGVFETAGFTVRDGERYRVWKRVFDWFPILKEMPTAKPSKRMLASIDKCIGMYETLEESYENEKKVNDALVSLCEEGKWEMDCEHAFSQLTFDGTSLEEDLPGVNDIGLLGSGVYSHWRYITHWGFNERLLDEKSREWFLMVMPYLRERVSSAIE